MPSQMVKDLGLHLAKSTIETMQMHMARAAIMDIPPEDMPLIAGGAIQGVAVTYAAYVRAADPTAPPDRIAMQVASAIYKQVEQALRDNAMAVR